MLKNAVRGLTLCLLILPLLSHAETESGELIIAQDIPGKNYRFDGSQMRSLEHQYEVTYRIHAGKITRTKVYDMIKKETLGVDPVTYAIETEQPKKPDGKPFIRAIARPGNGSVEILEIGETSMQAIRSNGQDVVVSSMKRTDTVELPDIPGGEMKDEPVPLAEDAPAVPDAPGSAAAKTPAEQKAYDDGHASGIELSNTGKFANPFPEDGPANERQAWFQGFKVGLNAEVKKEGEKPSAHRAEAGE